MQLFKYLQIITIIILSPFYHIAQETYWKIYSNSETGINSNITCIVEDMNNDLWLGTKSQGLFKFDGTVWTNYNRDNSLFPSKWVNSIAVDSNNVKWIGSYKDGGGLTKYNDLEWFTYDLQHYGITENVIYDIQIDRNGMFWMGTYWQGLVEFDGDTTFNIYNSSNSNIYASFDEILSINVDNDSLVYCGSEKIGAAVFNKNDSSWTEYFSEDYPNLPGESFPINEVVQAIKVDNNQNIWFAGNGDISKLDVSSNWKRYHYGEAYQFNDIIVINDSSILFTEIENGLLLFNINNEEWINIIPPDTSLIGVGADGLMKDNNNNIWVGYSNGLVAVYNIDEITAINVNEEVSIDNYSIKQNYPNPFNPSTKIDFSIPKQSNVKLEILDALGRKVKTLVNKELTTGNHTVNFNASSLSSGIYFYRIISDKFISTKKMILLK